MFRTNSRSSHRPPAAQNRFPLTRFTKQMFVKLRATATAMTTSTRTPHADSRQPQVLNAAARLFRTQGFDGTSVRNIAGSAGMLPGSLYCHFATKEALLIAVYIKGVEQISGAVLQAISGIADPWDRLQAACEAHLDAILRDDDYAQVVIRVRPSDVPDASERLIDLRNQYEALFAAIVNDLPLAASIDRRAFRLMLMGALNWSQTWFRPDGRSSPRSIARQFVALLRQGEEIVA